jgi:multidrug resistance efflux pump
VDELEGAQEDYDDLLDTDAAENIEYARGRVFVAEQRYDAAYARLLALQTGENSPAVIAAKNAVDQAQKNVAQAEASLALVEAQIAKLTVNAPMDGVILTRNVEPGEFVQPGAVALKLADLNNLTITVYVPENRYGEIMLGQTAEVTVDSFPNEVFTACGHSHLRQSRVHPAQRPNRGRAQFDGLCHQVESGKCGWEVEDRYASGRSFSKQ